MCEIQIGEWAQATTVSYDYWDKLNYSRNVLKQNNYENDHFFEWSTDLNQKQNIEYFNEMFITLFRGERKPKKKI